MNTCLYTIDEVAACLSVSKRTVHYIIARGELASCKIGRARRILGSDVQEFIEAHRFPSDEVRAHLARGAAIRTTIGSLRASEREV